MYKIAPEEGSAFFIRPDYLPTVPFENIDVGAEFNDQETDEILDAGLACVVELKAVEYLGVRPEACVAVGDRYDLDIAIPLDMGMGGILVTGVEEVYQIFEKCYNNWND